MTTDRKLLEGAAKAAGLIPEKYVGGHGLSVYNPSCGTGGNSFNPLTDDGDALRLAVKLNLLVDISIAHTEVNWFDLEKSETHTLEQGDNGMEPEERTRRAIVRAAYEISKGMK